MELDLSKFNTKNVKNMSFMFNYCSSLKKLNLSNFNTKNVTNMYCMFNNCSSLTNLDLSNFNTTNVKDMSNMFNNCSSLTELNLSNFNTKNVKDISLMFKSCFKNEATLICTASTIKKIANIGGGSYLTIPNDKKTDINDKLKENPKQVYTCTVKRVRNNPEITKVEEYQPHQ